MNRLELIPVVKQTFELLRRHGLRLYVDFLAASIAATTLYFLLFPTHVILQASSGEELSLLSYLVNAYTISYSLIYAPVTAMTVLYVWQKEHGRIPARRLFYSNLIPLLVLSLFLDHLVGFAVILFIFPAFALSAVTTVLIPALVIEGAGWGALKRSYQLTRKHFWTLCSAWSLVLVPWLLLGVFQASDTTPVQSSEIYQLWWDTLISSLVHPILSATSICLVVAIYRQLLEFESGGSKRDFGDIFR